MNDTFNTEVMFREDVVSYANEHAVSAAEKFAHDNGISDYRLVSTKTEDACLNGKRIPNALKVTHTWKVVDQ